MSEWQTYKLGDIAEIIGGGTPKTDIQEYWNGSIPWITPRDLTGYKKTFISKGERNITELGLENSSARVLPKNTVLLTSRAPIGYVAISDCEVTTNQGFKSIVPNEAIVESRFIYYWIKSNVDYLQGLGSGTTFAEISGGVVKEIELDVPPIEEQKAIASVLSSLDDKIDLLHRQNTTLERMAETLFRQWFVEEAQEDWDECTLDDLITVKGGTTPSTKDPSFWNGNINWTSPRDLSNQQSVFMFDTERKITEKGLAQIGSGLLPVGTLLMSSRAPIGYLAITDIPVAINQGYIAIICDKLVSNYFMYLWCKVNMEQIKNAGNGSTFEEISKSNFKELSTLKPSKEAITKFDEAADPVFAKIKTNQKQIQTLEKLRDNLLPKLMSGEVRVA